MTFLYALAGLAAGVFVRSAALQIVAFQKVEDPILGGVLPATTLLGLVAGGLTFVAFRRNRGAGEFVESAITEVEQVSWPNRDETVSNTGIVISAALGFGVLMFVYDFSWSQITAYALYTGVGN